MAETNPYEAPAAKSYESVDGSIVGRIDLPEEAEEVIFDYNLSDRSLDQTVSSERWISAGFQSWERHRDRIQFLPKKTGLYCAIDTHQQVHLYVHAYGGVPPMVQRWKETRYLTDIPLVNDISDCKILKISTHQYQIVQNEGLFSVEVRIVCRPQIAISEKFKRALNRVNDKIDFGARNYLTELLFY